MLPGASRSSDASRLLEDLDTWDASVGTKAVPRRRPAEVLLERGQLPAVVVVEELVVGVVGAASHDPAWPAFWLERVRALVSEDDGSRRAVGTGDNPLHTECRERAGGIEDVNFVPALGEEEIDLIVA